MCAAVILTALIRWASVCVSVHVYACAFAWSLSFSLLLQLSSHLCLPSRLLPTHRINHNERLEFLGDAVVEFLTRWESARASLIDATANWSRLQHYLPFFPPRSFRTLSLHFSLSLIVYIYLCLSRPRSSPYFPLIQDSDLLVIGTGM